MHMILQVVFVAILATTEARYKPALVLEEPHFFNDPEAGHWLPSSPDVLLSGKELFVEEVAKASPSDPDSRIIRSPDDKKSENAMNGDYLIYSIKKKQRQAKALNKLYEDIAAKFPFLIKQGLFNSGSPPSLDHLLSMTVFSQPKMG